MGEPFVLKSLNPEGWPDRIHAGKAVIRLPNGVESGNWQTRPDLDDDRTTEYVRADTRPAATLAEALAVPEIAAMVESYADAVNALDWCARDGRMASTGLCELVKKWAAEHSAALDQIKALDTTTKPN